MRLDMELQWEVSTLRVHHPRRSLHRLRDIMLTVSGGAPAVEVTREEGEEEDISFGIMVPRVSSPPPFIILQFPSPPRGVPDCVTSGVEEAAVEEATPSEDLPIPSERFNKHARLSTAAFPSRWVCYSESDQRICWVIVSEIETLRQQHWSSLNITDTRWRVKSPEAVALRTQRLKREEIASFSLRDGYQSEPRASSLRKRSEGSERHAVTPDEEEEEEADEKQRDTAAAARGL
ncbi:hypothetical protein EYF80_047351 [Liparis tanakae]|uniref:Uncharacterized protein n=1 Tax=Liparis tanakae TaxID=230148 RepID=A0A4Z2FNY6_9TELE|nr:hypothetical protein EYF80_047351 [Liparis tanakae]